MNMDRRRMLMGIGVSGAALFLNSCVSLSYSRSDNNTLPLKDDEGEVTAVEDLMREHGVLRRALFIYAEMATGLDKDPAACKLEALQKTAGLFRSFGEDYHEKKLEEAYIFPQVKRTGGPSAKLTDILISQHRRGREITDYFLAVSQNRNFHAGNAAALAKTLESFVRMYAIHTAIEDTDIFPEWKKSLSSAQLDEMGDKFEDIEREQLGKDGFENTLKQVSDIEFSLGMSDLAKFTAPPPPSL